MRRLIVLVAISVVGLIIVLTFRTHVLEAPTPSSPPAAISRAATSSSPTATAKRALRGGAHTATGAPVATDWGVVQVVVRTANGRITEIATVKLPHGNPTDIEINKTAVPQLRQAALAAQSAHIDMISGATVTSDGYLRSLQSALDQLYV